MANQKTDSSGQPVQPRAITHFGDGSVALTNRDVSADLAKLDMALTALRDALTAASPNNKTLKDLYDQLHGSVVFSDALVNVPAGGYQTIDFQPAAGKIRKVWRVGVRMCSGAADSFSKLHYFFDTVPWGDNVQPWLWNVSGADFTTGASLNGWESDNTHYLRIQLYNASGSVCTDGGYHYIATER